MGSTAISNALARMTAAGAFSEFAFNPVFGRLSDKYGRKPFLVGGASSKSCCSVPNPG
eukprot:SAG22_NODE_13192_length_415_cov_0.816456_2_plen_58_part_01